MRSNQISNRFESDVKMQKLRELRLSNHRFRELWEDYCEVLQALEPFDELHRLRTDLEQEIEKELGKRS